MSILTTLLGEVCVLSTRLISSSKRTEIISLYIILPSFIKIGQELFEIIGVQTHTHTHRQTHTAGHDIFARILFSRIFSFELLAHLIFAYQLVFLYYSLLLFDSRASYFRDFCRNREIRENKMHAKISCPTNQAWLSDGTSGKTTKAEQ